MNNFYTSLPDDLKTNAIDTENTGAMGFAWNKEHIYRILDLLEESNYAVLGGDVYIIKNNRPILTYDSWYYENKSILMFSDYVKNSIEYSKKYITDYCMRNTGEYYFSITFKEFYADYYKS